MDERPEAIIVTLSQREIQEKGYRNIIKQWESCSDRYFWFYKCGNAPKMPVTTVYWVVMGRIRWKCLLIDIHRKTSMNFDNMPGEHYAKAWLQLTDFERIPRRQQVVRKGFQGFRYSEKI